MPLLVNPPASRPKAIIFDIGRVIIGVDMGPAFAVLGEAKRLSLDGVWNILQAAPEWSDWQEGRLSAGDFHQYICATLGCTMTFDRFCTAWNSMLAPKILLPETVFERLASSFRLALLSNTDPIHSAYIEANYSFVRYFPVRVYSCRFGSSKPKPAIYEHTLHELKVAPHEALFIDDLYENAAAAADLGMASLHCTSTQDLPDQLSRL